MSNSFTTSSSVFIHSLVQDDVTGLDVFLSFAKLCYSFMVLKRVMYVLQLCECMFFFFSSRTKCIFILEWGTKETLQKLLQEKNSRENSIFGFSLLSSFFSPEFQATLCALSEKDHHVQRYCACKISTQRAEETLPRQLITLGQPTLTVLQQLPSWHAIFSFFLFDMYQGMSGQKRSIERHKKISQKPK